VAVAVSCAPALGQTAIAPADGSDQVSCIGDTLTLAATSTAGVESAVLCLINGYRRLEGRSPLRRVTALSSSAASHAHRMIAEHFFSHVDPDGTTLSERLRTHHYFTSKTRRWAAAENIGMAGGALATAHHIVADWMASAEHRANLLRSGLRDVGVGVVPGSPQSTGANPLTVVVDLGFRR
jgi:uncharacterized protein YkwD